MAKYEGSSLSSSIMDKRANILLRREAMDSILAFMLGVAYVIRDQRLIHTTNLMWEPLGIPMDEPYVFTYEGAGPIDFPEGWYAGGLIVPDLIRIKLQDDEVTYNFMQTFNDAEEKYFREVDVAIESPRDAVYCSWNLSVVDQTNERHYLNLPATDVMTSESNDDFSVMANNILQALRLGTATRFEYE